jgi:hypothetical protein
MGFIDAINAVERWVTAPSYWLTSRQYGTRLMRTGLQGVARLDGIKTTHTALNHPEYVWLHALTIRRPDGTTFRAGCKQALGPHRDRVRLGCELLVRHDRRGRRVVVDWPAMLERWGLESPWDTPERWRPLRRPPADGINDHVQRGRRKALERGERTTGVVLRAVHPEGAFGPDIRWDVHLQLPDGAEVVRRKEDVPDYAAFLLAPGTPLPVSIERDRDRDKLTVDWLSAAQAGVLPDATRP